MMRTLGRDHEKNRFVKSKPAAKPAKQAAKPIKAKAPPAKTAKPAATKVETKKIELKKPIMEKP